MNESSHTTAPKHDPFAARVLERIEAERVEPRSKWAFRARNALFWTLGACAVLLGALASGAAIFEIENTDWALFPATHQDLFSFLLSAVPFVWLVVLILFAALGYENIRRTKRGYRYPLPIIVSGAVLTSVVLGVALYASGFAGPVEEAVGDHPPFYRPIFVEERADWLRPENGLLLGTIVASDPDFATFTLKDVAGTVWTVSGEDLRGFDMAVVARGGEVRVVGVPFTGASSTPFHACFVFPLQHRGVPGSLTLPPPVAVLSSTTERNVATERSDVCKGIRPYEALRTIER